MKARKDCLKCLRNLTLQTIDNSISEKPSLKLQEAVLKKLLITFLDQEFNTHKVPAAIFTKINRRIKKITLVNNPFKKRKAQEIENCRNIIKNIKKNYLNTLEELLLLSVLGNALDFFKTIVNSNKEMSKKIKFTKADFKKFKYALKKAKKIIFFADNAGEVFFDVPLVKLLSKKARTIYVVKAKPVQNDLTLADLKKTLLINIIPEVITSGNDAVGIEMSTSSKKLKQEMKNCDIIIAKGMGYYETFSGLSNLAEFSGKIYYLLMAKCPPVAQSLGVKLNSYLFLKG
ncbi:MAG: ARMT1-like domain-containing protein [Candidatus Omnitrophota bacterium]